MQKILFLHKILFNSNLQVARDLQAFQCLWYKTDLNTIPYSGHSPLWRAICGGSGQGVVFFISLKEWTQNSAFNMSLRNKSVNQFPVTAFLSHFSSWTLNVFFVCFFLIVLKYRYHLPKRKLYLLNTNQPHLSRPWQPLLSLWIWLL